MNINKDNKNNINSNNDNNKIIIIIWHSILNRVIY